MRKMILFTVIASIISITASYGLDLNISGAGARAKGMGGAFIGIADDATAVGWNPAGLAQLDRPEASAVGVFNATKFTSEWTATGGGVSLSGSEENSVHHIAPNFFSLVLPIKMSSRNLSFAVAYQRLVDFGEIATDTGTAASGHYEQENKYTGGIDAISPAVAIQIVPQLSIGVAGNIIVNGAKYTEDRTYDNSAYYYNYEENMDFSGFNINAGILANLSPKFSLGAAMRLPYTLSRTGDWKESHNYVSGSGSSSEKLLDPEREWTMPLMIGAGIGFRPSENLTLAFDFEHRGYGSTEFTYYWKDASGAIHDTTMDAGWMSINQFRVGMEYVIVGQSAVFPIRLGFKTNPLIEPEEKWTETSTGWTCDSTVTTGMAFTGGFGIKLGKLWFDLAYEMGMTTQNYSENYLSGLAIEAKNKELSHTILASCIFHF